MKNVFLIAIVVAALSACTFAHDEKGDFPKTVRLSEIERTQFIPTLERKFDRDKNAIYAATLLMACDELEGQVDTPLQNIESLDLEKMIGSSSHQNVLSKSDYLAEIEVLDNVIKTRAFFRKSLPFSTPLRRNNSDLLFKNAAVENFGFTGYDESVAHILYYLNEDDFAISLKVQDDQHEIVFIKTDFGNRIKMTKELKNLEEQKKLFLDSLNNSTYWKSHFNEGDVFAAPVLEFSIETFYPDIAGTTFLGGEQMYTIEQIYQRTSLVLDEKGAEIESEGVMEVEATEEVEEIKIIPRNFFLDNNYMVMLKRKDSYYPYFAMYVTNDVLMQKR